MSGLDKIIADIGENAKNQSEKIIADATEAAKIYTASQEAKAKAECDKMLEKSKKQSDAADAMATASGELLLKQSVLASKVEIIDGVIAEALNTCLNLDDKSYFEAVTKVILGSVQKKPGLLRFNAGDLKRLPSDYIVELQKKLPDGAVLTLDSKTADIRGGCVLIYGEIEENLSFDAIAASRKDALRDKASTILF